MSMKLGFGVGDFSLLVVEEVRQGEGDGGGCDDRTDGWRWGGTVMRAPA
jgi:hypothetical protein